MTITGEWKKNQEELSFDDLSSCLSQTFSEIENMKIKAGIEGPSLFNLVLTNGKAMIATRYSTEPEAETRSLHIASNAECYTCEEGLLKFKSIKKEERGVLISSEVLTENKDHWTEIPENHCIMVGEDLAIDIKPLK